jgi:predicted site-specific integrase-resolvase
MQDQSARRAPSVATVLQPAQIAAVLQVSPKTIARWTKQGLLPCQRTTLVDHSRYPAVIEQLAASLVQEVRAT